MSGICQRLGPGIRRAHVDDPHSFYSGARRLDAEKARGLAVLHTTPEFSFGGDNEMLVQRIGMSGDAREPVMAWYRQVRGADWATPADVKRAIRSASILKDGRAVFNIAGNKYRIVVWINYPYRVVYVRFIGTHRQYDRIDAQTV